MSSCSSTSPPAWTCDRLYAIKRPLAYRALRGNKRQFALLIGLCWLMAIVPTVPLWFDTTLIDAWELGEKEGIDCMCFYPLENVGISSRLYFYALFL